MIKNILICIVLKIFRVKYHILKNPKGYAIDYGTINELSSKLIKRFILKESIRIIEKPFDINQCKKGIMRPIKKYNGVFTEYWKV